MWNVLNNMGGLYRRTGQVRTHISLCRCHAMSGTDVAHLGQYTKAMDVYKQVRVCLRLCYAMPETVTRGFQALEIAQSHENALWNITVGCNIGEVYMAMGLPTRALACCERYLEFGAQSGNPVPPLQS